MAPACASHGIFGVGTQRNPQKNPPKSKATYYRTDLTFKRGSLKSQGGLFVLRSHARGRVSIRKAASRSPIVFLIFLFFSFSIPVWITKNWREREPRDMPHGERAPCKKSLSQSSFDQDNLNRLTNSLEPRDHSTEQAQPTLWFSTKKKDIRVKNFNAAELQLASRQLSQTCLLTIFFHFFVVFAFSPQEKTEFFNCGFFDQKP